MSSDKMAAQIKQELERIETDLIPMQEEAKRLRGALAALEGGSTTSGGGKQRRQDAEATRKAVREVIAATPGIRGRQIAERLGITASYAYNLVGQMDGVERSSGGGYQLTEESGGASGGDTTEQ
jgi:hypothetical protein